MDLHTRRPSKRLRVLDDIERRGDLDACRRARKLKRWLSREHEETGLALHASTSSDLPAAARGLCLGSCWKLKRPQPCGVMALLTTTSPAGEGAVYSVRRGLLKRFSGVGPDVR
jgi:hypothetical protein